MFNLDEIDVDFNDEIFDDFKSKSSLNLNESSTDKGVLSYGISINFERQNEISLPKKLCLENKNPPSQLSILSKANDSQNIKDYQEKYSKTQRFQSSNQLKQKSSQRTVDSLSYSPITSTQKEINPNNKGYLFDSTNRISPIKIKPGICSELRKPDFNTNSYGKNSSNSSDNKLFNNSRKFPGPAGNLPKVSNYNFHSVLGDNKFTEINKPEKTNTSTQKSHSKTFTSYSNQLEFSETWKMTKQILGNYRWLEFQKYNLENVYKKIKQPNGLPNSKIPIICLVLTEIEYMPMDAAAILADETGSIRCAIHRQVLESYNEKLKTGSVLILKKVSIFSPSGKKYYFNVTKSNILDIISPGDEDWGSHSLICEKDIENIINECSKIPPIIFDPKSTLNDLINPAPVNQSVNRQIAPPIATDKNEIEFFDDGANFHFRDFEMDEFLVSFMDESFGGDGHYL